MKIAEFFLILPNFKSEPVAFPDQPKSIFRSFVNQKRSKDKSEENDKPIGKQIDNQEY